MTHFPPHTWAIEQTPAEYAAELAGWYPGSQNESDVWRSVNAYTRLREELARVAPDMVAVKEHWDARRIATLALFQRDYKAFRKANP